MKLIKRHLWKPKLAFYDKEDNLISFAYYPGACEPPPRFPKNCTRHDFIVSWIDNIIFGLKDSSDRRE